MADSRVSVVVGGIAARGCIETSDLALLRAWIASDGQDPRETFRLLTGLERGLSGTRDPGWSTLHAAALSSALRAGSAAPGPIAPADADWLMESLGPRLATVVELESLVAALAGATHVPPPLSAFALMQVRDGCLTGEGPTTRGRCHFSRTVDAGDVVWLRWILQAGGGTAGAPVSRAEATVLFDLHDRTVGAQNHPGFEAIFVAAITGHVLSASGLPAPPRATLFGGTEPTTGIAGLFATLGAAGYALPVRDASPASPARPAISADAAAWLARHIMRDGRPTPAEKALVDRLLGASDAAGASLVDLTIRAA